MAKYKYAKPYTGPVPNKPAAAPANPYAKLEEAIRLAKERKTGVKKS